MMDVMKFDEIYINEFVSMNKKKKILIKVYKIDKSL